MPDYIYLLENRLSADQQSALKHLREAAREAGMILFLTGDAVRDLTSGHAVRDLEVAVHGNALKLKKSIEKLGGAIWGESAGTKTLYVCFPGTVRVDVVSTHRMDYTKIDKPVYHPATIQEDLRRRDFTVNSMAISLNEGSFGLLMDPLNGAADMEARALRLVSNYGFLEEPSLLIRATRYLSRLGWEMDPKTASRYENAKGDGAIERLSDEERSRELEQIGHEAEALKVLRALEAEGWMEVLFPAWTSAKADEEKLKALHDLAVELLLQGVHADTSAAQMQLLTAKLSSKDLTALKQALLRPGFVEEWNSLDAQAAKFAKVLLAKENAVPSAAFKLLTSYDPEAVLWLAFTSKDKTVQERFNQFLKVWPEAKQKIPHALMQEMRITPELANYGEVVHAVFLQLIDGKLLTPEEMRAFLEPYSPPAPPPQVTIKRPRAKRGEAKVKERSFDEDEESEELDEDEDLDDLGGDDEEIDLNLPKGELDAELGDGEPEGSDEDEQEDEEDEEKPAKRGAKSAPGGKAGKAAAAAPAAKGKPAKEEAAPRAGAHTAQAAAKAEPAPGKKTASVPEVKKGQGAPAPVTVAKKQAPQAPVPAVKPAKAPAAKPAAAKPAPASKAVKASAAKTKAPAKPVKAKPVAAKKPAPAPAKKAAPKGKPNKPAAKAAKKR